MGYQQIKLFFCHLWCQKKEKFIYSIVSHLIIILWVHCILFYSSETISLFYQKLYQALTWAYSYRTESWRRVQIFEVGFRGRLTDQPVSLRDALKTTWQYLFMLFLWKHSICINIKGASYSHWKRQRKMTVL